jgi:hypothetical protein
MADPKGGDTMAKSKRIDSERVLFARIGHMHNYAGSIPGDARPIGGGGFNKNNIGHEIYNYKVTRGRLYGYFQPNMASNSVALERVDPALSPEDQTATNVLLIFVARLKGGGQVVVGWYRSATLYRHGIRRSPGKPAKYGHYAVAEASNAVLLPDANRRWEVPHGKNGMGQSNVCYPYYRNGVPKALPWIRRIIRLIEGYQGPNLLASPEAGAEADSANAVERALARSQGQGFASTPEQRRAIEDHSMAAAKRHYQRNGYEVTDVSKQKSWDFECRKGRGVLHVEVKGTTTDGRTVVLTKNEVTHALSGKARCVLFVLHSIKLKGKRASGGKSNILDPWSLQRASLTAITYTYRI